MKITADTLTTLFRHHRWANLRLLMYFDQHGR